MNIDLKWYKEEVEIEHQNILQYWLNNTIDKKREGFYGRIDENNKVDVDAPKGAVLNARILWSFSAGYLHNPKQEYLDAAHRAFQFITKYLIDREDDGAYWSVTAEGKPHNTEKQLYGIAFILYGLSEYYRASKNEAAKHEAIVTYTTMLEHGHDKEYGGFWEGFDRQWKKPMEVGYRKSMNTHLHVIESFANLYLAWPDGGLKEQIRQLLIIFADKIIDNKTGHQRLFFDARWNVVPPEIESYGHDIEAAWLLLESAMIIKDEQMIKRFKDLSMKLTLAGRKGVDKDGGMWYELHIHDKKLNSQKHWWPQSEAMVGFFNAWQLTGDEKYLNDSINTWKFVKAHILDKKYGEWYSGVYNDRTIIPGGDKVGLWKCPYHNSRACLEIIKRIDEVASHS